MGKYNPLPFWFNPMLELNFDCSTFQLLFDDGTLVVMCVTELATAVTRYANFGSSNIRLQKYLHCVREVTSWSSSVGIERANSFATKEKLYYILLIGSLQFCSSTFYSIGIIVSRAYCSCMVIAERRRAIHYNGSDN